MDPVHFSQSCPTQDSEHEGLELPFFGKRPSFQQVLGPPVERSESGYLFSVVYFSRGTLPQNKVKRHYWGTWSMKVDSRPVFHRGCPELPVHFRDRW